MKKMFFAVAEAEANTRVLTSRTAAAPNTPADRIPIAESRPASKSGRQRSAPAPVGLTRGCDDSLADLEFTPLAPLFELAEAEGVFAQSNVQRSSTTHRIHLQRGGPSAGFLLWEV